MSAIRNGGRALHWRGPGATIGRCNNATTRGGRNTTTARGDGGGRREPRNAPSRSRRAAGQVAPTWCREYAAVCPRRLQIHPALQARGAVQEEAPLNSVVRSTRRTVRSTYGVLVRVWGGCGCEGMWVYFAVPRDGESCPPRSPTRLQYPPPARDLGWNGIVAVYGRVLSDVRL